MYCGFLYKFAKLKAPDPLPGAPTLEEVQTTPTVGQRLLGGAGGAAIGLRAGGILGELIGRKTDLEPSASKNIGRALGAVGGAGLGAGVFPLIGSMMGAGMTAAYGGRRLGNAAENWLREQGIDVDPGEVEFAGRLGLGIPSAMAAHKIYDLLGRTQ